MIESDLKAAAVRVGDWLNDGGPRSQAQDVRHVAETLALMQSAEDRAHPGERERLLLELMIRLQKYRGNINPEYIPPNRQWVVYWAVDPSSVNQEEWFAVNTLIGIAKAGRLSYFRKCKSCNRWIFAKKADQNCCGSPRRCRQDWSEHNKEERAREKQIRANNRTAKKVIANAPIKKSKGGKHAKKKA